MKNFQKIWSVFPVLGLTAILATNTVACTKVTTVEFKYNPAIESSGYWSKDPNQQSKSAGYGLQWNTLPGNTELTIIEVLEKQKAAIAKLDSFFNVGAANRPTTLKSEKLSEIKFTYSQEKEIIDPSLGIKIICFEVDNILSISH